MAVISVYATRVADPDFWGHLRYGQFFVEQGLRAPDPFAYTSTGLQWYGHEYLAQIALWEAYALGGAFGLVLLKCLIGGAAVMCMYGAVREAGGDCRTWVPVFVLTAGIVARSFLFRPQLFSFLFFSYFVLILFRHLHGKRSWLWTLPPVLAVWANMHGAFLAGLGAIGLTLLLRGLQSLFGTGPRFRTLFKDTWPLGLTFLVSLGATLLNPLSWRLWIYLLTEMTHDTNRRFIDEWRPLDPQTHTWSAVTLGMVLLGLIFTGILAQLRSGGRRAGNEQRLPMALPPWVWLLSCLPLTLMAFQAVRHIPVFVLWAAPVLALLARSATAGWAQSGLWQRGWFVFSGAVGTIALLTVHVVSLNPAPTMSLDGGTVLGPTNPIRVTRFLRDNELKGNVYNPLWWGSYLTWELYPDMRVAMDGRNVTLFPVRMVEENLLYYTEGERAGAPMSYRTDFLLVPTDSPALPHVDEKAWFRIYRDDDAVLYVRHDAAHQGIIRRYRQGRLVVPPPGVPAHFE
jgi:hypothetical protein